MSMPSDLHGLSHIGIAAHLQKKKRGRRRKRAAETAVAFLRTSTEEQDLGPQGQRLEIEQWASEQGITIVAWFEERMSGAAPLDERVVLWDAVNYAVANRVAQLVVSRRDRLARDPINVTLVSRYLEREGVRVRSADGTGDDTSPEGILLQRMLDAIAAYERALIRARTKAALRAKKQRGERGPGLPPYGSRVSADGKHLEPNPAELDVITRMRAERAAGLSLTEIAGRLNADNVPARGEKWHRTTVYRILSR